MPLEIEDWFNDEIFFGDLTSDLMKIRTSDDSVFVITKENAQQIISHLQEQFNL